MPLLSSSGCAHRVIQTVRISFSRQGLGLRPSNTPETRSIKRRLESLKYWEIIADKTHRVRLVVGLFVSSRFNWSGALHSGCASAIQIVCPCDEIRVVRLTDRLACFTDCLERFAGQFCLPQAGRSPSGFPTPALFISDRPNLLAQIPMRTLSGVAVLFLELLKEPCWQEQSEPRQLSTRSRCIQ